VFSLVWRLHVIFSKGRNNETTVIKKEIEKTLKPYGT